MAELHGKAGHASHLDGLIHQLLWRKDLADKTLALGLLCCHTVACKTRHVSSGQWYMNKKEGAE